MRQVSGRNFRRSRRPMRTREQYRRMALTDPAYAQPDEYISDVGATWIEHWAVTRGREEPSGATPTLPAGVKERHLALAPEGGK